MLERHLMVANLTNAKKSSKCSKLRISVAKINDFVGSNRYYDGNRKNREVQTVSIIHVHEPNYGYYFVSNL
jgi:hypothetical protein